MTKYLGTPKNCLRNNAFIILMAIGGIYILHAYLSYLHNTWIPFPPSPLNDISWPHIKMLIFLCWLLLLLSCLQASKTKLLITGYSVKRAVILRSSLASLIFAISVTGYEPPNIELSAYFFINAIAYGMLIYAFFSIACFRYCCAIVGKYILQLLRLPAFYWVTLAFIFVFLMAYHMSWVLFEHFPWIDDTIVQLVHAKFILQGHWFGESQFLKQFFDMKMMINDGKWYSQYPPGHVLLLAIGMALHHAEMVNPFLGACTCIAVWLLAKELYGSHVAKIAVLLTALCTYLIVFSSEYMNNATSLLTGTLFLWAYFRVLHRPGGSYALVAGAALGYCFITRPYSAFALATPAALYALYLVAVKPRSYLLPMILMAGIFAYFVIFQLYYNAVTTGDPLVFGYQILQGDKHNPFTQAAIQKLTPERLYKTLRLNLQRLNYFNRMLFEWPLPPLALVGLLFGLRGNRRDEQLLLLTLFSMFISVQFTIHEDIGWGPRLVYEISGILLVLCAKAMSLIPPLLRTLSSRRYSLGYYYGSGIMILMSFYAFSFQYNLTIPVIRDVYVLNSREGNPEFYKSIVQQIKPPALVFMPWYLYKFVSFTNPPTDSSPVVFAIDHDDYNQELMKQYPERNVYKVNATIVSELKRSLLYCPDLLAEPFILEIIRNGTRLK